MRSVIIGNKGIAQILIKKGASVNATNDDGDSALNLAAKNCKNQLRKNSQLYNFLWLKQNKKGNQQT